MMVIERGLAHDGDRAGIAADLRLDALRLRPDAGRALALHGANRLAALEADWAGVEPHQPDLLSLADHNLTNGA